MIRYRGFTKRFGTRTVVDNLTLHVPAGAVMALLGPNGSGKTTSIKAAAGLLRPSSGQVLLGADGLDAANPRARQACAFLPQRVSFPETLTGREVVEFYRRLRGAPQGSTERALRFASLNGSSGRAVGTYSGGMMQRLGLAVAITAPTSLLLLDEPTAALDPEGLDAFYRVIEDRRRTGGAVFFSSHQLGDVERVADFVGVLVAGRLVATLTARDLAERLADRGVMRVRFAAVVPGLLEALRPHVARAEWIGNDLVLRASAVERPELLARIATAGATPLGLTTEEGRLDGLYHELVGGAS